MTPDAYEPPSRETIRSLHKYGHLRTTDSSAPIRDRSKNRSLSGISQLDISLLPSKQPCSAGESNSNTSQAYAGAMKALQDKLKQVNEKLKEYEKEKEMREEKFKLELHSLNLRHQDELNQFTQAERINKETLESLERQNLELRSLLNSLQQEKSSLERKIDELCNMRIEMENKIVSLNQENVHHQKTQKYKDAEITRMKEELEEDRRSDTVLRERLQQTIIDSNNEKDTLKAKNEALVQTLRSLEKDYSECKDVYNNHVQEMITTNKELNQEIAELKQGFSKQMVEFDHELGEIEKSHRGKIEDYEHTIKVLRTRNSQLEELCSFRQRELSIRNDKARDDIRANETKRIIKPVNLDLNGINNRVFQDSIRSQTLESQDNRENTIGSSSRREYLSDKKPRNQQSPQSYIKTESAYVGSGAKRPPNYKLVDPKRQLWEGGLDMSRSERSNRKSLQSHNHLSERFGRPEKVQLRSSANINYRQTPAPFDVNKDNLSTILNNTHFAQTPGSNTIDRELEKYLSPTESNKSLLHSKSHENLKFGDLVNSVTTHRQVEGRESIQHRRNPSFGSQELPSRVTFAGGSKDELADSSIRGAGDAVIRKHREGLLSSIKGNCSKQILITKAN